MSTDRNRSESWYADYAARRSRWSTKPEQAQAAQGSLTAEQEKAIRAARVTTTTTDDSEYMDLGIGTQRIPRTGDNVADVIPYGEPIPVLLKPPPGLKRRGTDIIRDLFGKKVAPPKEGDVLPSILKALQVHPLVAWVERMNIGGAWFPRSKEDWYTPITFVEMKRKWRYVAYGDKGMCDITGQLKDGRRLEVEGKRVGENPEPDQVLFMDKVRRFGGVAFVAYSIVDVKRELGPFAAQRERPIA